MDTIKIYQCEDTIDGIFTAVYDAWSSGYGHENVKIEVKEKKNTYTDMQLFSEYIAVKTDIGKALKVSRSIKEKISEEIYKTVCRVALSDNHEKGDLIYRFLVLGFRMGSDVADYLSNDAVNKVIKISRSVNNEVSNFLGFLRFTELDNGVLTSLIHPKNNILALITPHFADRLPCERFIIIDGNRNICSLHVPGKPWVIADIPEDDKGAVNQLENDDRYRDLWKVFFENIAIKERMNLKLQRNKVPLRYRTDMTEFLP